MQSAQRKFDYDDSTYPARKRVVKMQGNVAYINTDPVRTVRKAQPSTQSRPKNAKPAKKPQNKAKAASKAAAIRRERAEARRCHASTLFVIFLAFCALSLLISRYAAFYSIGVQNNTIKQDITAMEGDIDRLQLEMELRDNVEDIQDTAKNVLNMAYPTQDQKITINMSG